ncbi:hypothetical protein MHPYR_480027 [uncultured Mycobacterium sp.]|uniref:Uncharacterized protein n=1 Tax=uncultured Mycobacterium sp. TaxID=171292 RepID=A0A1Y5PK13_9MYCO|nr:hypothetical protein MHPYR_480027 [uncultured Mycobacterium sp.]
MEVRGYRRQIPSPGADIPQFSTYTTWHLCLTDLARMGWELHGIGHQSTESTLTFIHLSGRDFAEKLNRSMTYVHAQRIATLTAVDGTGRARRGRFRCPSKAPSWTECTARIAPESTALQQGRASQRRRQRRETYRALRCQYSPHVALFLFVRC